MKPPRKRLLVVDGYNVLNAWRSDLDSASLADAREELAHRLANYAGYTDQKVVLVYDAWMSDRMQRTSEERSLVTVVYTRKNETADHYIERLCDSYAKEVEYGRLEIRVATSDNVEQTVILGRGATRLSSRELLYEMDQVRRQGAAEHAAPRVSAKDTVMDRLPESVRRKLDEMRRGEA